MSEEILEFVQIEYAISPTRPSGVPWALVAIDHGKPNDAIIIFAIKACTTWVARSEPATLLKSVATRLTTAFRSTPENGKRLTAYGD